MKEWFQVNRWLGTFLVAFGAGTLFALILLWFARSGYQEASAHFREAALERNRLERLDPFPNEENYKKMQSLIPDYNAALDSFQKEIKGHVLPQLPLAPNEFQSRLRQALIATAEKARSNKVKLPNKFFLGFDEFASGLPGTAAAPLLGQELSQVQFLMNILIDARVDGITELRRSPLAEERGLTATPTPAPGSQNPNQPTTVPTAVQRSIVDLAFTAAPSAARKALNQIAAANDQFFIIRTLHVRNQQQKGPPRAGTSGAQPTPAKQPGALSFIVGNEHVEVSARIEILRFVFGKS